MLVLTCKRGTLRRGIANFWQRIIALVLLLLFLYYLSLFLVIIVVTRGPSGNKNSEILGQWNFHHYFIIAVGLTICGFHIYPYQNAISRRDYAMNNSTPSGQKSRKYPKIQESPLLSTSPSGNFSTCFCLSGCFCCPCC